MVGKDIKPNLSICAGGFRYREKKKEGKIGCVERASSDEKQFRVLTNEYRRGAFGGNRGTRPVPPEKGVFPLDHMHLCDMDKKEYISCLKSEGHKSEKCRQFSKKYLECRMEKNLMAKQDMSELGFREDMALQASANVYD